MKLPDQYAWLAKEPAPRILLEALKLYGIEERAGNENNPEILRWAGVLGLHQYNADDIPWCGLFMAYVAYMAGKKAPAFPLLARNWAGFGNACEPELGCVLVFSRGDGKGHVGIYVGENTNCYFVYGGNQGDRVSIVPIDKKRLIASRSFYNVKPANIRKVFLSATGPVSTNEQ